MLGVIGDLPGAAALSLAECLFHALRHPVGIENNPPLGIARRPANGLDQRGHAAQKAFLIGIQNGHEAAFGNIQPLPQQVDAHQHIKAAAAQVADDFDALQRVHIRMQIAHANAGLGHVFGQILGHALGQHRHQNAAALQGHLPHLGQQVIHLALHRADVTNGVHQPGGADHLLGEDAAGALHLPGAGGGGDEDGLRPEGIPFLKAQRAIVDAARQAETMLDQGGLAGKVAAEHAADLRHGDVAFIDDQQGIVWQIFKQRGRRLARIAAGEIARIILDAFAGTGGLHHLHIEDSALFQALGFQQAAGGMQLLQPGLQFGLDALHRLAERGPWRDIVAIGVDVDFFQLAGDLAGQRVKLANAVHLIAEEADPPGAVLQLRGPEIDILTPHTKAATGKGHVVAAILLLDQALDQQITVDPPAPLQLHHHLRIGFDRADTIDAADTGHDDRVIALQQRLGGGVPHAVDLFVDLTVFFYVGISPRHIGLRLIIIIVTDKILDGVVRKKALHLAIELRRKRLIRRQNQGWLLHHLHHLGHGEGFARAGDAEQHLILLGRLNAGDQLTDGIGLVAIRLEGADHFEPPGEFRRRARRRDEGDRREADIHPPNICPCGAGTISYMAGDIPAHAKAWPPAGRWWRA